MRAIRDKHNRRAFRSRFPSQISGLQDGLIQRRRLAAIQHLQIIQRGENHFRIAGEWNHNPDVVIIGHQGEAGCGAVLHMRAECGPQRGKAFPRHTAAGIHHQHQRKRLDISHRQRALGRQLRPNEAQHYEHDE